MGLYGVMVTGASGMAVQADRLGTVADNVANIGTTGYKRASTEFSTLIPQEAVVDYRSGVVETDVRRAIDEQGGFEYTRSVTDLAISGGGFFVVSGPNGQPVLTRAGAFVPDGEGRLVNAAGFSLMGYNLLTGSGSPIVNAPGGLEEVRTSSLGLRADPSSEGSLQVNLPSTAAAVPAADLPTANAASAQYSAKTSLIGYDNLGSEVTFDAYFAKTGANAWEIAVYDRAAA